MVALTLSVVILTYQRLDALALCLERLAPRAQTLPISEYEVIVTDDGSQTTAEQMILKQFPWARWVQGPRRGPAANRNHGARQSRGDWLVFIDDDCLPAPELLKGYLAEIEKSPGQTVLEGRTSAYGERKRVDEEAPINEDGGYLWSCNFAIQKVLFNGLGGFDENYPTAFMEDVDLYTRIKKMGIKARFVPKARVFHPWRKQPGRAAKIMHQKSLRYYLSKHPELAQDHAPGVLIKNLIRYLIKMLVNDCRRYRGRGFMRCCSLKIYVTYLVIRNQGDDPRREMSDIL